MNRTQMTAPFAEEELRTFQGRGGKTMTYIEDETVMDRLDAGYGFGNWQIQVEPIPYVEGVVKVRLGVRENAEWTWFEDFGYPNGPSGETLKEAVSDGIRRCGRYLGIARDLYRAADPERSGATDRAPAERQPVHTDGQEWSRLLGEISRTGAVARGTGTGYKLEAREEPAGTHAIGFRLELGDNKHIPQVLAKGELGEALYLAIAQKPERLYGQRMTLTGDLYEVGQAGRRAYHRLVLEKTDGTHRIETDEFTLPAPSEPESVPAFTEDELAGIEA